MKAKTYAITVQYGGGFHLFRGYADTEAEALATAKTVDFYSQSGYNAKTGRRGVRPRVMVWKQVEVPKDEVPSVDTSGQVPATPPEPLRFTFEQGDGSITVYPANRQPVDNIEKLRGALEDIATGDETSTVAGAVAIAKSALLERLPLGALGGEE